MNELDKLRKMLTDAGIPYKDIISWRNCVTYGDPLPGKPKTGKYLWDGICQPGSYGYEEGLIESWGKLGADENGQPQVVAADEAFEVIKAHWEAQNGCH